MRLTTWILSLLCLAAVGLIGGLLFSGGDRTPKELLESARRRAQGADPDTKGAIADLDHALRLALQESPADKSLVADILLTHGTLMRGVGSMVKARNDFQAILDTWRPGDPEVELKLIDLDVREEQLDAALERATNLLKREPDQLEGWTRRGSILIALSEKRIVQACEIADGAMAEDDAREAQRLMERAAGMDLADPLRVSVLHALRAKFEDSEDSEVREVLRLLDLASRDVSEARVSLVQSFRGRLSRDALYAYLRVLQRSGRPQDAIDFGQAIVVHPAANGDREIMHEILKSQIEIGRPDVGADIIDMRFARGVVPDQAFFETWSEALYRAERWRQLTFIALEMLKYSDEDRKSYARFYIGVGQARDRQCDHALNSLARYLQGETHEPIAGAIVIARRAQAHCAQAQGEVFNEKPALIDLLQRDPEGSGEDWLRFAEVLRQTEPESLDKIEDALTHAIRLDPERRADLLPRWAEVGEAHLRSSGVALELLIEELSSLGQSTPLGAAGPYEIYRLAQMHAERDNVAQAMAACRRLLDRYPRFLPAVDLLADLAQKAGDEVTAAEMWLSHLEASGPDAAILRKLGRLPDDALTNAQWLQLVEIDPERTGRLLAAKTLRQDDRSLDALTGLYALDTAPLGDDGRLLIGNLYSDLKRWAPALDALMAIKPGSPQFAAALPLALQAAIELRDSAKLQTLIEEVGEEIDVEPLSLILGADLLIAGGFADEARALCLAVDGQKRSRTSGALLRLAQVALIKGERANATEALERASAFDERGGGELGRLLLAIEDHEWSRLPLYVRDYMRAGGRPPKLSSAILAYCDERADEADRLLADALRATPDDARMLLASTAIAMVRGIGGDDAQPFGEENEAQTIAFLRGSEESPRDPREALAYLLALENREWTAWAVAQLGEYQLGDSGAMWARFLAARGEIALGYRDRAEQTLLELVRAFPSFAPAWRLLEESMLERLGRYDDVELVRLRYARRQALGERADEAAETLLVEAWELEKQNDLEGAAAKARASLDVDPKLLPALVKLGDLEAARGRHIDAISAYAQACSLAPVRSDSPIVADFAAALRRGAQEAPAEVTPTVRAARLEVLVRRFPTDPLIALELARLDLAMSPTNPAVGVARAYDRLERFRSSTRRGAVEILRRGMTRAWTDFYAALDPARAEQFVLDELEKRPGSIELRIMLGEVLARRGEPDRAIELYELVQRMVPDGPTRRAIAWLLSDTGKEIDRVRESIKAAMRLERLEQPDLDLEFTEARAFVNAGSGSRDAGIEILRKLWDERATRCTGRVSQADLGQFFGTTLVQRARHTDRQLASQVLGEVHDSIDDPARKNLLKALGHLALQIPARQGAE